VGICPRAVRQPKAHAHPIQIHKKTKHRCESVDSRSTQITDTLFTSKFSLSCSLSFSFVGRYQLMHSMPTQHFEFEKKKEKIHEKLPTKKKRKRTRQRK